MDLCIWLNITTRLQLNADMNNFRGHSKFPGNGLVCKKFLVKTTSDDQMEFRLAAVRFATIMEAGLAQPIKYKESHIFAIFVPALTTLGRF